MLVFIMYGICPLECHFRDGPLFFIEGGLPFLGLADNFFCRVMRFKQYFSLHFCNENNFYMTIFKKCYRLVYRSYLKKHSLCMHTHEESHLNEKTHPE